MGVSEGSMVAVGEFVGVTEGGKEGVIVSAGVRVGVTGVGVMKKICRDAALQSLYLE